MWGNCVTACSDLHHDSSHLDARCSRPVRRTPTVRLTVAACRFLGFWPRREVRHSRTEVATRSTVLWCCQRRSVSAVRNGKYTPSTCFPRSGVPFQKPCPVDDLQGTVHLADGGHRRGVVFHKRHFLKKVMSVSAPEPSRRLRSTCHHVMASFLIGSSTPRKAVLEAKLAVLVRTLAALGNLCR